MINETTTNEIKRYDLPMTTFSMKTRTRFGTWNVRTLMEASRLAQLSKEFMSYNLSFLGICEMRWPNSGETTTTNGLHLLYSGKPANEKRSSGVGFLLSREAHKALISWKPYSDRIIAIRLRTRARNLTCIQCYAPTEVSDFDVKEEFYSLLDRAITSSNRGDILVVMGDFNAQIGSDNTGLESIMGVHGLGQRSENGELFINMCAENNLVIGGTLFPHKPKHKITWVSPDHVTENQIDHIAISRKWRGSLLDVRNKRGADVASDHHLLIANMRIKIAAVKKKDPRISKRFDVSRLKIPSVASNFSNAINESLTSTPQDQRRDWKVTKNILVNAATEHIGLKENKRKEWLSEETWTIINERKKLKAALNSAKTRSEKSTLQNQHASLDRKVKRSARKDKRAWMNAIAEEAQAAAETNRTNDLYRLIKKLSSNSHSVSGKPVKDNSGTLITSKDEQLELWATHFSEMLAPRPQATAPICSCINHNTRPNISITPPVMPEIVQAVIALKNNKSPGNDNISPELLKLNSRTSAELIFPIIEEIWLSEIIPDELKEGIIVKIPKKGDLTNRNNWRGITLLSMINKVLAHVINKRLADSLMPDLRRQQAGFCPNMSCVDHINSLRVIVEQSVEWRSPLYLIFIDFEKAFDTLAHDVIWNALECKGVPRKLIQLIKCLYTGASCRILHDGMLSRKIEVGTGVRQGCVMSPLLFNIVLDIVMQHAMVGNRGIVWGLNERLEDLEYADDICLLSHNHTDMSTKLKRLIDISEKAGLKINIKKTKVMRINSENVNSFLVKNETLEEVDTFCYLGAIINRTGGSSEDIASRIKKGTQSFGQLNKVWKSSTISHRIKINIFNSNVKSTLLYGCETWNAAPRDIKSLQVFVNKCLRRILRIFWPRTISNINLWRETMQTPMCVEIQRRKWNWIGHTLRKQPSDIARNAIEWNPQGSRRTGRPAHTWRRQIDSEIRKMRKSWSEVKNIASDRSEWRKFVEALCSL